MADDFEGSVGSDVADEQQTASEETQEATEQSEAKRKSKFSEDREKAFKKGYNKALQDFQMQSGFSAPAPAPAPMPMAPPQGQMGNMPQQQPEQQPAMFNPEHVQQEVQRQMAMQEHARMMQAALAEVGRKVMRDKDNYPDYENTINDFHRKAPDLVNQLLPALSQHEEAAGILYELSKNPLKAGAIRNTFDSPALLQDALSSLASQVRASKPDAKKQQEPIEPPQTGHGVGGSVNSANLQDLKNLFARGKY